MRPERKQHIRTLIEDAKSFRACGPSDDPDEQTSVTSSYKYIVTQFQNLVAPILPPQQAELLRSIKVQIDDLYSVYDARASLDSLMFDIEEVLDELDDPLQVFLPAGSSHDAYIEIRKIMLQVTVEVLIVDSYVDETLWPLLTNVPTIAKIRILTMRAKGDFALEGSKFAKQHGQAIEVRTNTTFHDRFIFVDGKSCWHLGASIKDAGAKAFAMSQFADPKIAAFIKQEAEATWNVSTPLIG
jgi:hypothetical protein